jgi:hypothetical protein
MKFYTILACCLFSVSAIAEDKKKELPKHKTPEEAVKAFIDGVRGKPDEMLPHMSTDFKKKFFAQTVRTTANSLEKEQYLGVMVDKDKLPKFIADLQPLAKKYKLSAKDLQAREKKAQKKMRDFKPSNDQEKDFPVVMKMFVEFLDDMLSDIKDPEAFNNEYMTIYSKYAPSRTKDQSEKLILEDVKVDGDRAKLNLYFERNGEKEKRPYPFRLIKINDGWLVDIGPDDISF